MIDENLTDELLATTDTDDTKRIVDMFNLHIKKKEIIRASKYSDLLDNIAEQIEKRVTQTPDQFSNKDLVDYVNTLQKAITTSTTATVDSLPVIQMTQNNAITVNSGEALDRTSIDKIKDVLKAILEAPEEEREEMIDVTDFVDIVEEDQDEPDI